MTNHLRYFIAFLILPLFSLSETSYGVAMKQDNIVITKPLSIKDGEQFLYPKTSPYDEGFLKVSKIHKIKYAQYGNPKGIPAVFLHGGPGVGCRDSDVRIFDPAKYRIVIFDQRGAGKSEPQGELAENNRENLIADIEQLRNHLDIEKWLVVGGSWGSTLALSYGEAHPEHCIGFILRGLFLGRKSDIDHIWQNTRELYPEAWDRMVKDVPENEQGNLLKVYYERISGNNQQVADKAAYDFMYFDMLISKLFVDAEEANTLLKNNPSFLNISKFFIHYAFHNFYLNEGQLLENLNRINHLPCTIVHGRYDMLCRMEGAYDLHNNWPGSKLIIVSDAGHSSTEPGITNALVESTKAFVAGIK